MCLYSNETERLASVLSQNTSECGDGVTRLYHL